MKILTLFVLLLACGVSSDTGKVVTESGGETGELDEGPPCGPTGIVVGTNNHMESDGECHCDEGFSWCDPTDLTSLDCCPE